MEPLAISEAGLVVASEHVLGRSDQAAVILRVAVAYATGLRVNMSAVTKASNEDHWHDDLTGEPGSIAFTAIWVDEHGEMPADAATALIIPDQESELARRPVQAGGGSNNYEITQWLSPLRSAGGVVRLFLAWPRLDISVQHFDIRVPDRNDLETRTRKLWP